MIVNPPRDALTSRYDFVLRQAGGQAVFAWGDGGLPFRCENARCSYRRDVFVSV